MKEPIVFRCDTDLWDMLARGEKTWDARRWDLADDRIYRLAWGLTTAKHGRTARPGMERKHNWVPDEHTVSFQNKATGEVLTFRYLGMEFTPWAPGWTFLLLGELVVEEKGQ